MARPNLLILVQHLRIEQDKEHAFIKLLVAHRGIGFIKIEFRDLRETAIHRGFDGGRSEKVPQGNGRAGTRNHFGGSQIIGERLLESGRVGQPRRIAEVELVPIAVEHILGTLRRFGDNSRNQRKGVTTLRRGGNGIRLTTGRSRTSARGAQQHTQQHRRSPRTEGPEVKCVIHFLAFHNISILSCFIHVYALLAHLPPRPAEPDPFLPASYGRLFREAGLWARVDCSEGRMFIRSYTCIRASDVRTLYTCHRSSNRYFYGLASRYTRNPSSSFPSWYQRAHSFLLPYVIHLYQGSD